MADGAALLLAEVAAALRSGQQPPPMREQSQDLDQLLAEAEVIFSARRLPPNLVSRAPRLRWIQFPMAGVDWVKDTELWKNTRVIITTASGVVARPIAEYVLMAMLILAKDLRRTLASQEARKWDRYDRGQLGGKTVGILGYGAIGQEVARLAQAFDMRVLATKRRVAPREGLPPWVLPKEGMDRLLQESHYVVLTVPATRETIGMIGARQLAAMRPGSVLINVSRGDMVDEAALIDALQRGHLSGAALDVFQSEPLPPESPLWSMPGVLVSAHSAGLFEGYDAAVVELFAANLARYLDGQPLLNQVNRRTGY